MARTPNAHGRTVFGSNQSRTRRPGVVDGPQKKKKRVREKGREMGAERERECVEERERNVRTADEEEWGRVSDGNTYTDYAQ